MSRPGRLQFIDFTRGVVMAIMAWDHVSGFWNRWHQGSEGLMGAAPTFVNLKWFLSRYVSHYCAPTFIFLAGTVLAISTIRREAAGESELSISKRMVIRGVLLLLFEFLTVSQAFDLPVLYFGVIACIGASFIIFSVARKLPKPLILLSSVLIILGHPFLRLDFIPQTMAWGWYLRLIIHEPSFIWSPYVGLYPIIPWIGVMGLGWVFGSYLSTKSHEGLSKIKKPLIIAGVASIATFLMVRSFNGFGNLVPRQGDTIIYPDGSVFHIDMSISQTIIDWMYVSKYPPDVAFLLWTLGGMCIMMYLGLRLQSKPGFNEGVTGVILTFGRNPLFFYLTHLWLYRLRLPLKPRSNLVLPMFPTIMFWFVGLTVLWKMCERYELIKRSHPNSILQYI